MYFIYRKIWLIKDWMTPSMSKLSALYQPVSRTLSVWDSAAAGPDWYRLFPPALHHSHTSTRHSKGNWDGTNKTQPKSLKKILQQIQYSWGAFTYRYAYTWKTDMSHCFLFPKHTKGYCGTASLSKKLPISMWRALEHSMFPSSRSTM